MTTPQIGEEESKLPFHWQQVHSAIWLIGLALLFYLNAFWPGILALVAISGLAQAIMSYYVQRRRAAAESEQQRATALPAHCPNCGGMLSPDTVTWIGPATATCPYCGSTVRAVRSNDTPKDT